ncbi:GDSL-type esterase/lipase family protein [Leifsonia sp. A12D58]|uniref:GDSL-type esterase/lipase family protein n=1 Tax=Leifsonia sp. A12D58 TaxID=3397674 RepID=UPI0039E1D889
MTDSLVFIGDGLTSGGRWDEWFPEFNVHNFGVSGETTDALLLRLQQVSELEPNAVIVQIGTNDVGWRRSDEYIVRNVETILYRLRKQLPDTRILAQSIPPRERDHVDVIRSINRHIRQFAPTLHAGYLDLWPMLADPDGEISEGFSEDRLHLNDAGYAVWLAEMKLALELLYETPTSTSVIPVQYI